MRAREVGEPNRAATPLELLFDLTFVAAVAQLAGRLAHATTAGDTTAALGPFLMVFFAIWWAWMNFTWFASAYDCDDVGYRIAAFVQMGGVLVLAAGIGPAFDRGDFTAVTVGYLIMRVGLLSLWLRAAVQDQSGRRTALRYAGGVALLELLWISRLHVGGDVATRTFVALVVLELLVPVWAERAAPTRWHPHHIAERYSLFAIILLGESILAATTAVVVVVEEGPGPELAAVSVAELVIVAALWWLYFVVPAGADLAARRSWSFVWGYGHFVVFAALAALAAGLEVVVAASAGHVDEPGARAAVAAVAVPVAAVLVVLELVQVPAFGQWPHVSWSTTAAVLALALVVAAAADIGLVTGVLLVAAVLVGTVVADDVELASRRASMKEMARSRS